MKCQIKIITWCYYSIKADKELERGNFETHVPSHHCLLSMRQHLPVGLQAKKTFICPKMLRGGLWKLHQGFETSTENFSFLRFGSPRTTKCNFKVNVAFLNSCWDHCKTSLCEFFACMMAIFWNSKNSWTKSHECFQGKHPNTSSQDTLLCSSFPFQPAAPENRARRLVWDTSSFYSSKIKFGCLVNIAFLQYLKNMNQIKIASGFSEEIGSLGSLIVHSRQIMWRRGQGSQCCTGETLSTPAAAALCSSPKTQPVSHPFQWESPSTTSKEGPQSGVGWKGL